MDMQVNMCSPLLAIISQNNYQVNIAYKRVKPVVATLSTPIIPKVKPLNYRSLK